MPRAILPFVAAWLTLSATARAQDTAAARPAPTREQLDSLIAAKLFSNTSGALADRAVDAIFLACKAYGDSRMR